MDEHLIPHRVSAYELEEIDGELLLYSAERTRAVYVNSTAALVLNLCDGSRSVGSISDLLQQSYARDSDTIAEDVQHTLEELEKCGAVEFR